MDKSTPNLKVILLSNDKYGEGLNELSGANYITEKIQNHLAKTMLNKDDIILLKDINHAEAINTIYDFIDKMEHNDDEIFMFYFCGHGKELFDNTKELVLALNDTTSNNYSSVGIRFNDLVNKVKQSNIKRFICIIDSCSSGVINTMGENKRYVDIKNLSEGHVYISSVTGILPAYEVEIDNRKVPLFSHCFLQALETLSNEGNKFSIHDVFLKTKYFISKPQFNVRMEPTSKYKDNLFNEKIFSGFKNAKTCSNEGVSPEIIDWRITSKCNNTCGVCYACNNGPDMEEKYIDVVIDKISGLSCKSVCVSGGEPTSSKYFKKIMSRLNENGYSIFLSTNGYDFMSYRDIIEDYIDKLSLPLDGYDTKSNMSNGRNEESFECVKKILDYYKERTCKFDIKISTVLTRKTCTTSYLEKIFELLKEYNISMWKIYEFIPENRGIENQNEFS